MKRRSRGELVVTAALGILGTMAPTAGDIGGCGEAASLLDAEAFFASKGEVDCTRCVECDLRSAACSRACSGDWPRSFPSGCRPLRHDGEVCLRALEASGCDEYAGYMSDQGATTANECNFCPVR